MDLQNVLRELEASGIENDSCQSDKSKKYLNITRDTGEFLAVLVKATKSVRILEIGTSNGYSTLWLASALPGNGLVTTIELSEQKAKKARANFERAGLSARIRLLRGDASDVLSGLNEAFDMVFLDADRSLYMPLRSDFLRLLKPGGVLVCDNAVSHKEELAEFMNHFAASTEFATCLVPVGKGEFVVYKSP